MRTCHLPGLGAAAVAILLGGWISLARTAAPPEEKERKVTEAEVPKPALDALKKLAKGAAITEFAEEVEHGHTFYEGSWAGPNGNIDGLVTPTGDLVEIEETVSADRVPAAVRAEGAKAAGKDTPLTFEMKTVMMYELHYKKDGKGHELVLTPDGRQVHEEHAKKAGGGDDDDDDDEKENDKD